jgi:hypothetical protein
MDGRKRRKVTAKISILTSGTSYAKYDAINGQSVNSVLINLSEFVPYRNLPQNTAPVRVPALPKPGLKAKLAYYPGGKFVVSWAGEAYDKRAGVLNRKFRIGTAAAARLAPRPAVCREAIVKRLTPDFTPRAILVMCSTLVFLCATGGPAFAQQAGAHVGGVHLGAPPASHVIISRPIAPMRTMSVSGRVGSFAGSYPRLPIRPLRPVFPISGPFTGYPAFGTFGAPFFGLGLGFNSGLWPSCDFSLGWIYGCNGLPAYEYSPGYSAFSYSPGIYEPPIETQIWPLYIYGDEGAGFVQLYLKDGTVDNVIDYWLVDNQLHFKTVEEGGTKVVEHIIDFDQLDLQKTVDVNTQRGFRFVLRDEPFDQYLRDHPIGSPAEAPPAPSSPAPPQPPAP